MPALDEDDVLRSLLEQVVEVHRRFMHAQVRRDRAGSLIKYSRDWEYPWVLLQADVQPGETVLDCGAGYSPLMFIWAARGASVHCVDRDILIQSKGRYALQCLRYVAAFGKYAWQQPETWWDCACNLGIQWRRLWRPDFWGPIPPRLLRRYGITYQTGAKGDFTRLPYPDEAFDVVTCVSVLEHLPRDAQIRGMTEMARVVKKNGRLVVTYDEVEDHTAAFIEAAGLPVQGIATFTVPSEVRGGQPLDVVGMVFRKRAT
ncbi:MAG: hypothetical protein A3G77_03035 [Acidobacteria bacterium RIFCSPLOWO2_12_FULL_68_19]|nr:MAG: hypothetical protein A3G77_03035 [Acidobacteria bacterium RIFCSPLOWO2_12_FULL_68_19]